MLKWLTLILIFISIFAPEHSYAIFAFWKQRGVASSPGSWEVNLSGNLQKNVGHTAVWTGTEMIIWGGTAPGSIYQNTGGKYNPTTDTWVATSVGTNVPTARSNHIAVWSTTTSEMIVWGGYNSGGAINTGGKYNPGADTWATTSTGANVPSARYDHTAVWTGTQMIIWGGFDTALTNTGAKYTPGTDAWATTSVGANVPTARNHHTAVWTGTEMIIWGGSTSGGLVKTGGKYTPGADTWLATKATGGGSTGCPSAREYHTAVWTGTQMIIWGGGAPTTNTGSKYTPGTDAWLATSTGANVPDARVYHEAIWTGTEMIIWGGSDTSYVNLNSGSKYTPGTDAWVPTSAGLSSPAARSSHTAIWSTTTSEMIIWGGSGDAGYLNTGARYKPGTDTWNPTSGTGKAPSYRYNHSAVWTGTEMIIWGGSISFFEYFNTGSKYNPTTDTWAPTSTGANVPGVRYYHSAVWTGTEMIIWGGYAMGELNTGGKYNPSADTWATTSTGANVPGVRYYHSAVWTGTEMIIWGGFNGTGSINTGGKYIPGTDTWATTSTGANVPSARRRHTAVWTGTQMIIWGGWAGVDNTNDGGKYNPSADTWVAISTGANVPAKREYHSAVWTGTEMIIWGGTDSAAKNTGAKYTPGTDTWATTSTGANVPVARQNHTAVWTGTEMIVWGGYDGSVHLNTGGKYKPSTDSWITTSVGSNVPAATRYHTAVWTGTEMIVWGGTSDSEDVYLYTP